MAKTLISREILPQVLGHLKKSEITLIVGARQTGKTVLLGMIRDWLQKMKVPPERIFYFNLDIFKDLEFFQDQAKFIEWLKEKTQKGKIYVLVDEAQRVPECPRFFKGVYDSGLNVKLILTGSSSLELKARLKESLVGRKRIFHLFSFSFLEFLEAKEKELAQRLKKDQKLSFLSKKRLIELFKEYALWGGYPRVVLARSKEEKLNILAEIYTSYIEKEIVGFLAIRNRLAFSNLVKLLAGQTGSLVNIAELSSSLKIDRHTIQSYLKALEETFIVSSLSPFFKNPRQEIIKQNKIYFLDGGLRNYAIENFKDFEKRLDKGQVLENALFKELFLRLGPFQKIRFWRTKQKAEIDFIILGKEEVIPVEIKSSLKKPQLSLGLQNFLKKYQPKRAFVLNLSLEEKTKFYQTKVEFILPFQLSKIFSKRK